MTQTQPSPALANPSPLIGQIVGIKGRSFSVIRTGRAADENTNAALERQGLFPRLITLEALSGPSTGRQYSAVYRVATGEYENLIIYPR